jgi:CBS domain-containing protein
MNLREFIHAPAVMCSPDTSLAEAAAQMDRFNVGSVVVVDADGGLAGILTDRDVAVRGVAKHLEPGTPVRDVMTSNVIRLREDADLFDAARQMAESGCRRLPVVDAEGALKGVIALDDLMILFARRTDDLAHAVSFETHQPEPRVT